MSLMSQIPVSLVTSSSCFEAYAINVYQVRPKQTQILRNQLMRDIEYRRRGQASRVFVWVEDRRPVLVEFRDSAGVRWRADATGKSTQLYDDEMAQSHWKA